MDGLAKVYCGLDVHKRTVQAHVAKTAGDGRVVERQSRTFTTMIGDLERLAAWLEEEGCEAVAMESTGSFWKPVYNVLEQGSKA